MTRLRVGLVGCGKFVQTLLAPFSEFTDAEITAVCDIDLARAEAVGKQLGVPVFAAYEDLLRCAEIDSVLISTSHDTHLPIALAAAQAGKHIFCEKPMALTVAECQQMIAAAEQHRVRLCVGHVTRLLPLFARMKALLDSGIIGKPVAITMTRYWPIVRQGWWAKRNQKGGLLHSPASHEIDYLNYLCGAPASVYAVAAPQIQPQLDYEDTLLLTITYQNSVVASLATSISSTITMQHGFIIGERGGLKYDMYAPEGGVIEYQPAGGEKVREVIGDFGLSIAMKQELRSFIDYVLYDVEPLLTAEGGRLVVEIMQAAYQSAAEGKPILLPLQPVSPPRFEDESPLISPPRPQAKRRRGSRG